MAFISSTIFERILFTLVVVGLLLGLYGTVQAINFSIQLSNNIAQQFHDSGEELDIQSTAEGRGMMTADLERRELIRQRGQMLVFVGVGVVLIGIGWLGYDFRNSRREEDEIAIDDTSQVSSA